MIESLTESERGDYHDRGFLFPFRAISSEAAAQLLRRLDAVSPVEVSALPHPWYYKSYLLFTWLDELVRSAAVLDRVEGLIGEDIICISCDVWRKDPGETRHISFHQDASYWRFSSTEIVTAWVALTDVTGANGCMRFLSASHQLGLCEHVDTFASDNMLSHGQEAQIDVASSETVLVTLRAGEFSLHHCLLAHASGPNPTHVPRVGLCIRYAPGNLRQLDAEPVSVMEVRGHASGNLILETPPTSDLSPQAIAQHTRLLDPHAPTKYTRF